MVDTDNISSPGSRHIKMNQKMKPSSKKNLFADEESSSSDSNSSSSSEEDHAGEQPTKKNDGSSGSTSSSSSDESEAKLTVNKKFAKEYQDRKQREELRQVAQRRRENGLGSDNESNDESSSDEDEDEDGELLTDSINLQFLKTMKALKRKDATIYDPKARFFEEEEEQDDSDSDRDGKKRKPRKFKDVLRDQILEDMEKDNVDQSHGEKGDIKDSTSSKLAYDKQQEELRNAFLKETGGNNSDDEEEDWMVMKQKKGSSNSNPKDLEIQEEFKELEQLTESKNASNDAFTDPRGEVRNGEQFLIDYVKNKKWIDKHGKDEVNEDDDGDSSIEDLDRADDFEAKYNFRFEQAEAETAQSGAMLSIQTYARGQTMNTVRREDATRKDKRQKRKERKEAERKAKEEQLKRLKNAKRQEIEQKLNQVKAVIGAVDEEAVDEVAIMKMLEGDYDPEQFEKAMQEAYGDEFYAKQDSEWKSDVDVRNSLQTDEDGNAIVGQVDGGMYENDEEAYDEEGEAENLEEEEDNEEYVGGDDQGESQLEQKIKNKLQEELYKLDYEDIVAGMPTRFKYRKVEPNDYGLTTQEILLARDTTLKQFVSLKKMAPYNENGEHNAGSRKRRKFREMLRSDLEEEMAKEEPARDDSEGQDPEADHDGQSKKKRRRLKKGKKKSKDSSDENKQEQGVSALPKEPESSELEKEEGGKRKRRNKGKRDEEGEAEVEQMALGESTDLSNKEENTPTNKKSDRKSKSPLDSKHPEKSRRKKKKTKKVVASLPKSRLASYGL